MSPFDKARYEVLLKGLEISEVRLSDVQSSDASFRIDSEFFKPSDIADLKLVESCSHTTLRNIVRKIDVGFVGAMADEYTNDNSAPALLQTRNIKEFIVDDSDVVHIDRKFHECLRKSQIHKGDILVARSGSFGNAAVWLKSDIVNSSDIIIVESDTSRIDACYLVAMLNSRFGRFQLERFASGAVQGHVNLTILENLKIPVFGQSFQARVAELIKAAYKCFEESKAGFCEANGKLLAELGLASWTPTDKAISVKHYSDFVSAERFDAEYFQPKYDELFALLDRCTTRPLGGDTGLVDIQRSIEPGSDAYADKGIPFVRIADFTEMGITPPEIHISPDICADSPRPKKDTILLSKDGSVGIAYKVEDDLDVVTSSGILQLTVKDEAVLPDYLTLVLNSKIVHLQAERDAGGSIIQHWKQSEIERVRIPLLPLPRQRELAAKVQSSFALRAESRRLLDLAKHAVETAIEQGEENAMKNIKEFQDETR